MAHQSLYRRYRPRNFAEVKGQEHVVKALRNAVDTDSAAHAYMFSGPRGTGKTSTARIFAKALNCTSPQGGKPCCECDSCVAMEAGGSFDLFELDAASNNGVDAIRDLVERTMVVSPGRTKVYILDEVHMLSKGASNALLKTLEEPPEHVRFVLATTDPQKVLPTIRSRTQHFEFRLLSAGELTDHARWVAADAALEVDDTSIAHAVKQGRGSVRDMLSALDQVVAAGGVFERGEPVDDLFSAVATGSVGAALGAVADAIAQGHDPRVFAEAFVAEVREAFLISIGVDTSQLVDSDRERLGRWADKLGSAGLTKTMERIGSALVDMRSAADSRVPLEVALIQLTATSPDVGRPTAELGELWDRVERLEAALAGRVDPPPVDSATSTPSPTGDTPSVPAEPVRAEGATGGESTHRRGESVGGGGKAAEARAALRRTSRAKPPPPPPRASRTSRSSNASNASNPARQDPPEQPHMPTDAAPVAERSGASDVAMPDRDSLVMTFGDSVLPKLKGIARAVYTNGRFVSVDGDHAVFAVENAPTRDRAEPYREQVESLLSAEFSTSVRLRLVVEGDEGDAGGSGSPGAPNAAADPVVAGDAATGDVAAGDVPTVDITEADEADIMAHVSELEDADVQTSTVDRLTAAFPGAELIESEETT